MEPPSKMLACYHQGPARSLPRGQSPKVADYYMITRHCLPACLWPHQAPEQVRHEVDDKCKALRAELVAAIEALGNDAEAEAKLAAMREKTQAMCVRWVEIEMPPRSAERQ